MRNSWLVKKRCSDVGEGELPWSPAFQAGWEPPANKFLFDAVKTPDHVRLQDGENPEKNARKEGGSCPGTPQGSGPEWLDGWQESSPSRSSRAAACAKHPLLVPPRCFPEAEISPALAINVRVTRELAAFPPLFPRQSLAELLRPLPGMSSLPDRAAGSGGPGAPGWAGGEAGDPARPPIPWENLSFQGGRAGCGKAESPGTPITQREMDV